MRKKVLHKNNTFVIKINKPLMKFSLKEAKGSQAKSIKLSEQTNNLLAKKHKPSV